MSELSDYTNKYETYSLPGKDCPTCDMPVMSNGTVHICTEECCNYWELIQND